jgi:hypothetical protein
MKICGQFYRFETGLCLKTEEKYFQILVGKNLLEGNIPDSIPCWTVKSLCRFQPEICAKLLRQYYVSVESNRINFSVQVLAITASSGPNSTLNAFARLHSTFFGIDLCQWKSHVSEVYTEIPLIKNSLKLTSISSSFYPLGGYVTFRRWN